MGAYEYKALDAAGKEQRGVLEGDTARQIRQTLRDRKLLPLQVTEVAQREAKRQRSFSLRRGISAMDLSLITRQIATLVHAGLPLEESLQAVAQQSEKERLTSILLGVRSRVMEGHTLAEGLREFPQAFPEIYCATVAAGEQSGHLDIVLERLADYTESRQILRQKVSNALIYPIVLTTLAVLIVTLLLVYVVPEVVDVFQNVGQQLPLLTRALIGLSDFLRSNWWWLILTLIALAAGTRHLLKQEGPRTRFHYALLKMPIMGKLVRGVNTARFTRTLSILAGSGVPVLEALRIAGEVVINLPMRTAVKEAAVRVREGAAIGKSLDVGRMFPPMMIHLISSGEASGQLDSMLERAATNQEREMDSTLAVLLGILEPLLIVIMGIIVLTIVIAILMPIFQLNELAA